MKQGEYKRAKRMAVSLKRHREDWEPHFSQLERFILPNRGLFSRDVLSAERSKRGDRVNADMLDSTPRQALRILQSGLQAGITSPSRPWFRLRSSSLELRDRPAVKDYMAQCTNILRDLLQTTGMYNMLHTGYGDLGVYGTECGLVEDDPMYGLRPRQLVPGTYWLGASSHNLIDTMYREMNLTVNQIVGKFVYNEQRFGVPDWSVVPTRLRKQFDTGDVGEFWGIGHLITPRHADDDFAGLLAEDKPIASAYWLCDSGTSTEGSEFHSNTGKLLQASGYDTNPISASRWEVAGDMVYGHSPGMDALADCKELMIKRRDYLEGLRRMVRPPMNVHTDMRATGYSLAPGAMNYMQDPTKGATPAMDTRVPLGELSGDTEQTRQRVWSAMYADLFMMISQLDRRQITAREIDERSEEKLIALGPVLERLHFEKLGPLLDRLYKYADNAGLLPPPPSELEGEDIETEYTSMLAQAQKAVASGGVERLWGFVGNLSAVKPDVLDKMDADQSIEEYADMVGTPPNLVLSDQKVAEIRQARVEEQKKAQQLEAIERLAPAAQQTAQAAKVLSETDSPRGSAPGDILRRVGAAPGV